MALANNPWVGPWMNRQQIMSRLGRRYPVLYSDGAWSTWDVRKSEWPRARWRGAYEARDGVLVDHAPAFLLRTTQSAWVDRRVLQLTARRWRRRLDREAQGPLVAYVFHPRMWPYARALKPDLLVFHAYDLFDRQSGWNSELDGFQEALLQHASLILGSSAVICEALVRPGAATPILLPNGADYDAYAAGTTGAEPEDLAAIPRPRIGYIGKLSRKVDLPLVATLAARHPRWQFVFVGPTSTPDPETAAAFRRAQECRNVHFLGFKEHTALPQYAARMDANLISHRMDDELWTMGTFPLKLFEYLAAGPPVVTADIPSVRPYSHVVTIARTEAEWDAALTAIVDRGDVRETLAARQAVARENTWDHRVAQLDALLAERLSPC